MTSTFNSASTVRRLRGLVTRRPEWFAVLTWVAYCFAMLAFVPLLTQDQVTAASAVALLGQSVVRVLVPAALLTALGLALIAILVIALGFGRAGLRDERSRLLRWRVGVRWYAVALLTVPVMMTAIPGAFCSPRRTFLPDITAEDKASLLVGGLAAGLKSPINSGNDAALNPRADKRTLHVFGGTTVEACRVEGGCSFSGRN